jgi:hypothetical protein
MEYDYVVVGAGPAGLAFAQCCASVGKRVLILEREKTIGGCHRVRRVNGLFTEHGPRVYSSTYKTFEMLLNKMNIKFEDVFTAYNFNISAIGSKTIFNTLAVSELMSLAVAFLVKIVDSEYGRKVSMTEFMKEKEFRAESVNIIDRICRLTDGAGADRYSLHQFLELANQQYFYPLYQPKKPNDTHLFRLWKEYLDSTGLVRFLLETDVTGIESRNGKVTLKYKRKGIEWSIMAQECVLAIPPKNMTKLIQSYPGKDINGWANDTEYIDYISLTLHWDRRLELPKIHGFQDTPWAVVFIVLTDYMDMKDSRSQTVMSIAVTKLESVSNNVGKTANQCEYHEMVSEVFDQLLYSFPDLPPATHVTMSYTFSWKRYMTL